MLVKLGVGIERLNRPVRRALTLIDHLFTLGGEEAVITSTFEGSHSPGSLHYNNDAVDIRKPVKNQAKMVKDLKYTLGKDFDVVNERTHYHIEYDPK